eukprot:g4812.t1
MKWLPQRMELRLKRYRNLAATEIQTVFRGWCQRKKFQKLVATLTSAVLKIQCAIRQTLSRQNLNRLKEVARSEKPQPQESTQNDDGKKDDQGADVENSFDPAPEDIFGMGTPLEGGDEALPETPEGSSDEVPSKAQAEAPLKSALKSTRRDGKPGRRVHFGNDDRAAPTAEAQQQAKKDDDGGSDSGNQNEKKVAKDARPDAKSEEDDDARHSMFDRFESPAPREKIVIKDLLMKEPRRKHTITMTMLRSSLQGRNAEVPSSAEIERIGEDLSTMLSSFQCECAIHFLVPKSVAKKIRSVKMDSAIPLQFAGGRKRRGSHVQSTANGILCDVVCQARLDVGDRLARIDVVVPPYGVFSILTSATDSASAGSFISSDDVRYIWLTVCTDLDEAIADSENDQLLQRDFITAVELRNVSSSNANEAHVVARNLACAVSSMGVASLSFRTNAGSAKISIESGTGVMSIFGKSTREVSESSGGGDSWSDNVMVDLTGNGVADAKWDESDDNVESNVMGSFQAVGCEVEFTAIKIAEGEEYSPTILSFSRAGLCHIHLAAFTATEQGRQAWRPPHHSQPFVDVIVDLPPPSSEVELMERRDELLEENATLYKTPRTAIQWIARVFDLETSKWTYSNVIKYNGNGCIHVHFSTAKANGDISVESDDASNSTRTINLEDGTAQLVRPIEPSAINLFMLLYKMFTSTELTLAALKDKVPPQLMEEYQRAGDGGEQEEVESIMDPNDDSTFPDTVTEAGPNEAGEISVVWEAILHIRGSHPKALQIIAYRPADGAVIALVERPSGISSPEGTAGAQHQQEQEYLLGEDPVELIRNMRAQQDALFCEARDGHPFDKSDDEYIYHSEDEASQMTAEEAEEAERIALRNRELAIKQQQLEEKKAKYLQEIRQERAQRKKLEESGMISGLDSPGRRGVVRLAHEEAQKQRRCQEKEANEKALMQDADSEDEEKAEEEKETEGAEHDVDPFSADQSIPQNGDDAADNDDQGEGITNAEGERSEETGVVSGVGAKIEEEGAEKGDEEESEVDSDPFRGTNDEAGDESIPRDENESAIHREDDEEEEEEEEEEEDEANNTATEIDESHIHNHLTYDIRDTDDGNNATDIMPILWTVRFSGEDDEFHATRYRHDDTPHGSLYIVLDLAEESEADDEWVALEKDPPVLELVECLDVDSTALFALVAREIGQQEELETIAEET